MGVSSIFCFHCLTEISFFCHVFNIPLSPIQISFLTLHFKFMFLSLIHFILFSLLQVSTAASCDWLISSSGKVVAIGFSVTIALAVALHSFS